MKEITNEMKKLLDEPLPAEAVKPHPTKKFLSTIKSIYVTERLNNVFGVGAWKVKTDFITVSNKMVVCKTTLEIPEFGIYYECFGGNDNADLGDAFKGATTDAITKIGSWLGIGANIWKDKKNDQHEQQAKKQEPARGEQKKEEPKKQTKDAFQIGWDDWFNANPAILDFVEKFLGKKRDNWSREDYNTASGVATQKINGK